MANDEKPSTATQYALLDQWQPALTRAKDGANVSPAVLSSVLRQIHSRLLGSGVCFESQGAMARALKLNPKTVTRAVDVLVNLGVLTLQRKCRPGGKRPLNHHTIRWDAIRKLVPIVQPGEAEQTDIDSDQTDIDSDQTDMVSGTNGHGVQNKQTLCPEQTDMVSGTNGHSVRGTTIEATKEQPTSTTIETLPPEWEELVREVRDVYGVNSAPMAVREAKRRGLTIGGIRFILSKCCKDKPGVTCNALTKPPENRGLYSAEEANAAWERLRKELNQRVSRIVADIRNKRHREAERDRKAGIVISEFVPLALIFRDLTNNGLSQHATDAERDAHAQSLIAASSYTLDAEPEIKEWKYAKRPSKSKSATVA